MKNLILKSMIVMMVLFSMLWVHTGTAVATPSEDAFSKVDAVNNFKTSARDHRYRQARKVDARDVHVSLGLTGPQQAHVSIA